MNQISIQIGNIPNPIQVRKLVIDYRNLPICISHMEDTGIFRKRYVYNHNYGDHIRITIVMMPFVGKPQLLSYDYPITKSHRRPLHRKLKRPKSDIRQYVA